MASYRCGRDGVEMAAGVMAAGVANDSLTEIA